MMEPIRKKILTGAVAAVCLIGGAGLLHNTSAHAATVTSVVQASNNAGDVTNVAGAVDTQEAGDVTDVAGAVDTQEAGDVTDVAGAVDTQEAGDVTDVAGAVDTQEAGDTPDASSAQ